MRSIAGLVLFVGLNVLNICSVGAQSPIGIGDGRYPLVTEQATAEQNVSPPSSPLIVTSFRPTASGFDVEFNRALDASTLNLYDTESHQFGASDVTVVGAATGPVKGSLFVDAAAQSITFVKTGGLLLPDTYTVTLRSAVDGFRELSGELLDGDGDGVPGGNYVKNNFVISAPNAVVISVPDFAIGPGQSVNISFNRDGIPLNLSEGNGITAIDFTMTYDPALLTLTGVELGDSFPLDSPGGVGLSQPGTSQPGTLRVSLSWSTPLEEGRAELLRLVGFVPSTATYKATNLITFETASLNFQPQSAVTDDAVHVVAYIGDTTGNGSYSSLDGQRVLRVVVELDSGFAAYPLVDPVIIGDVTSSGSLSSLDATRILQRAAGLDRPEIPPIP